MKKILLFSTFLLAIGAMYYNTLTVQTDTQELTHTVPENIIEKKENLPQEVLVKKEPIQVQKKTEQKEQIAIKEDLIQQIPIASGSVNIKLPTVPKAITLKNNNVKGGRNITFSKRVPPDYVPHSFDKEQKEKKLAEKELTQKAKESPKNVKTSTAGEVEKGKMSTYLRGTYLTSEESQKKLKDAGFDVIGTTTINDEKSLTTILFTHPTLLSLAKKENKGFISSLRLLIDDTAKTISITNPLYLAKSYLQEGYDTHSVQKILNTLRTTFPNLKNSKDNLKYQLLSKYHFMMGMPYYEDMVEVASGKDLLNKIKNKNTIISTQKISDTTTILTVKLSKKTSQFIDKIGHNNASVLPYSIIIENDEAKILSPKYYIALMYPKLSMSQFMSISDIPDTIIEECENMFN